MASEPSDEGKSDIQSRMDKWITKMGPALKYYLSVEIVWHIVLFGVCWRFRPMVIASKSPWGQRMGNWFQNRFYRGNASSNRLTKFLKTPWQRATAEWAIINKVNYFWNTRWVQVFSSNDWIPFQDHSSHCLARENILRNPDIGTSWD